MIREHRGRRNLNDEQESYYIGVQYELEKKLQHRPENNGTKVGPLRTRETIAKQHHVSQQTVANAAKFTRAIDAIADAAGNGARKAILSRDVKMTRQDVQKLGEIAKAQPQGRVVKMATRLRHANASQSSITSVSGQLPALPSSPVP